MNKKCQVFTPENYVRELLDSVGYTEHLYGKRILENSCGDGNILVVVVQRYIDDCVAKGFSRTRIKNGLARDIYGVEIDPEQYQKCIENLNEVLQRNNINSVEWKIFNADYLRWNVASQFQFESTQPSASETAPIVCPKILVRIFWPVGVPAKPPKPVSRKLAGMACPTCAMAWMHSSAGIRLVHPARARSAAISALPAPIAFRFTHGTSTSPAIGSQTSPNKLLNAIATACALWAGVPPAASTAAAAAMALADPTSA